MKKAMIAVVVMMTVMEASAQNSATPQLATTPSATTLQSGVWQRAVNAATQVPGSNYYVQQYRETTFTAAPAEGTNQSFFDNYERVVLSGRGYDLGNNGSAAQGWSGGGIAGMEMNAYPRGIDQVIKGVMWKYGKGDSLGISMILKSYGSTTTSSDEGVVNLWIQSFQSDYTAGRVTDGATDGSQMITTSLTHGSVFNDGAILIDQSQPSGNVTVNKWGHDNNLNGMYYDLSSGTVPVSTAWGTIANCRNSGNGQWQQPVSTTCDVKLGSSPASPGSFKAGHIFLSGPFDEEADATSVGPVANGVQSITFMTRYAWNNGNNALVMQGGPGGLAMVDSSHLQDWPISFFIVGATSPTRMFFGNCAYGACNSGQSSISPGGGTAVTLFPSAEIIGTGQGQKNVAELGTNHIHFASGDNVISTPAAQYEQRGAKFLMSQHSPAPAYVGAVQSAGVDVIDVGPTPIGAAYSAINPGRDASNVGYAALFTHGGYQNLATMYFRPTNALLYVSGNAVTNTKDGGYAVFTDVPGHGVLGSLWFTPSSGVLSWNNLFNANQLAAGNGGNFGQFNVNQSGTVASINMTKTDGKLGVAPVVASPGRMNGLHANATGNLQCGGAICPAGMYRITIYGNVSSPGSGQLTLGCGWNDGSGPQSASGAPISLQGRNAGSEVCTVYTAGGQNITYSATLNGSAQYGLSIVMEKLN